MPPEIAREPSRQTRRIGHDVEGPLRHVANSPWQDIERPEACDRPLQDPDLVHLATTRKSVAIAAESRLEPQSLDHGGVFSDFRQRIGNGFEERGLEGP